MKRLISIFMILILAFAFACQAAAQAETRPILLIFETGKGEGVDNGLAAEMTKALRNYFSDTERVDVQVLDPQSATVQRAVLESKFTMDKVASYASQAERLEVGRALGVQYVAGGELSLKNNTITVKLWTAEVGGKGGKWETVTEANTGGGSANDVRNAMQSAVSSAVMDIAWQALKGLPRLKQAKPETGAETVALPPAEAPKAPAATSISDYVAKGDDSLQQGNTALAILQYSQAINGDPNNGMLRIKLAQAFARKALFEDANKELKKAEELGADKTQVDMARLEIEQIQSGKKDVPITATTPPASAVTASAGTNPPASSASLPSMTTTKVDLNATQATAPQPRRDVPPAIAKMVEGDDQWRKGDLDAAADAYKESIKLNQNDWRAYHRLALVNAAMSLFGESRKAMEQLKIVQPNPSADIVEVRYNSLRNAFDKSYDLLVKQYEQATIDFRSHAITYESYYLTVRGINLRLEEMAKFLDVLPAPPAQLPALKKRILACGTMVQATVAMLDYLETVNKKSQENATIFAASAAKQMGDARKLDQNKVIIKQ